MTSSELHARQNVVDLTMSSFFQAQSTSMNSHICSHPAISSSQATMIFAGPTEGVASPKQATSSVDDSVQALAVSGPQPEPDQAAGSADQSTEPKQAAHPSQVAPSDTEIAGQTQQASSTSTAAAAVTQAEAPRPVLPVADMAALAQRIGKASAASSSKATSAQSAALPQPHNAADDRAASAASGSIKVPAELQAIIHKLVAFIKVGPPGQAGCLVNHTNCTTLQAVLSLQPATQQDSRIEAWCCAPLRTASWQLVNLW